MKKIIIGFIAIVVLILNGCELTEDNSVVNERSPDDAVIDEEMGFGGVTKNQCLDSGGHWNECGSPCAGTDADFCIEMCQVQCECGGITGFGCPEGYKCRLSGGITDEIGVCVNG